MISGAVSEHLTLKALLAVRVTDSVGRETGFVKHAPMRNAKILIY
jgi:hypothetical protein